MTGEAFLNDRYRLEAELGRGGAGAIYRAYDTLLDRSVAVKVLAEQKLGTQGRARLLREAQAAARLNHPNIVSIYDAGESAGTTFIVMELIEGESLHDRPPANLEETIVIFRQICAALEHAHQHGIVHRDLKPENVLITPEGQAKLTDFGLARPVASRLTSEGEITGTVFYLAPEQALGQSVDTRTDLYSLGVMFYEMVTGQLPFVADDPIAVISQHLYAPIVPPRLRNAAVPLAMDALIVQLMAKTPADRPASATEVIRRLETLTKPESVPSLGEEPIMLERMARGRIIGRERELGEARLLWERAAAGEGQLLLISGEPGIGKTRLAREITTLAEVSGGISLLGECYPEGNAPYAPFAQIFRRVLSDSRPNPDLPPYVLADLIAVAPDLQMHYPEISANSHLDPFAEQQRLFENVASFFAALGRRNPCLLVLEDVHWADQATLALLRHLVRRARQQRLMIIATYREIELDEAMPLQEILLSLNRERLANRLKLARLDRQATRQMLAALLGEQAPEEFLDGIYQETEGNPFFVEEVCKAFVESGKLYFTEGRWHHPKQDELQIPQSVRLTIQARISKLPPEHQDVLRLAAILGRDFDFEILLNASELNEDLLIDALEQAEHAQLIEEVSSQKGGSFRFAHALILLTLVEGLSGLRRRKLHRQAAEVIEKLRPEDLEALAYQYSQAEDQEKALKYLKMAAERAQSRYANEDAIRYYTSALEFCESANKSRLELLAARVAIYDLVARRDKQLADIKEMQALAEALNDDPFRFQALIALADFYTNTDFTRARGPSQEALDLAKAMGNPENQARALYRLANAAWREGDLHRCVDYLDSAMELFQQVHLPRATIRCLYLLSLAYTNLGEHQSGQEAAEKALRLSRQIKDRRNEATSMRRLGIALDAQSRHEEALSLFLTALAMHREVGDRAEECNALNAVAGVLVELDRGEEARQYYIQGLEIAEATGNDFAIGMLTNNYVDAYFMRNHDFQAGLAFLDQQAEKARRINDRSLNFIVARFKTELYADLGQYLRALAEAEEALSMSELRGETHNQIDTLAWLGRLHALAGNPAAAHQFLQTSLERMRKSDDPESYVEPLFNAAYVAWLGDDPIEWQKGLDYARMVTDHLRKAKTEFPLAYSLDLEARLLLDLGDVAAALECSSETVQLVDKLKRTGSPDQFFFTHSRVLRASGREQEADDYLKRAHDYLMQIANKLSDKDLRQSFLTQVRYNREIIEESERKV
jgi:eukaryotic-like serine/threonine-protein kinase